MIFDGLGNDTYRCKWILVLSFFLIGTVLIFVAIAGGTQKQAIPVESLFMQLLASLHCSVQ